MKALMHIKNFVRNIWARITALLVLRRLKATPDSPLDFGRLTDQPEDWLIVMPVESGAFDVALVNCKDLIARVRGIRLHLLVPFEFRHWVETTPFLKVHPYEKKDLFWRRFPRQELLQRLRRLTPAVALDLCTTPSPLSLAVTGLSGARVRGSLARTQGDSIFNLLIESRAGEIGDRYRALFAYLS